MHKTSQKVDDTLFLGVLAAITLALLIWTCLVVYDIQQDVLEESPIPHVVACKSFTRADYVLMQQRSKEADITQ